MMNSLPSSLSNTEIFKFIEVKSRIELDGQRNRCMYALRLAGLRIKDIATISISQIVNVQDLTMRGVFVSQFDAQPFVLNSSFQAELRRYLLARFQITELDQLPLTAMTDVMFPNSKSKVRGFSPGTLARLFSVTDKQIREFAQALHCPANTPIRRFRQLFLRNDSCIAPVTENRFSGVLSLV